MIYTLLLTFASSFLFLQLFLILNSDPLSLTRSLARSCRPTKLSCPCSTGTSSAAVPPKHGYCGEQQP
jgi:hypothetical protein